MMSSFVIPFGHCDRGLSSMIVSNIETGAGSVAVSALPTFPRTYVDRGMVGDDGILDLDDPLRFRDVHARERDGHVEQRPLVERRHELAAPRLIIIGTASRSASRFAAIIVFRYWSDHRRTGP